MLSSKFSPRKRQQTDNCQYNKKRDRGDSDASDRSPKCRRTSQTLDESHARSDRDGNNTQNPLPGQLPSPTITRSGLGRSEQPSAITKRKAQSVHDSHPPKRPRTLSEPAQEPSSIEYWLKGLPQSKDFEPLPVVEPKEMNEPPQKRSRSDSKAETLSYLGDRSESAVSRDKKYSAYRDSDYPVVLETKGCFMRASASGLTDEDQALCEKLLTNLQPLPKDVLFGEHFKAFCTNLRGRSEARICIDLHPRIIPSVENLFITGRKEFEGLVEGYNDPWNKSILFYGSRPQPDHTLGYKWSNFNEQQRRKLNLEPTRKSLYTAREEIYFPFLTGEVKCGKQGLDLADRPNANSTAIMLRGVVDIYRRIKRPSDVHRRVLAFSISHDDNGARIYAHYPEIDGDKTTFWRETLANFTFEHDNGRERWKCYHFTLNVCTIFAPAFLERLREAIDQLPDPINQSFGMTTTFDRIGIQNLPDDNSTVESQDEGFKKPSSNRGLNAELRNMIQILQRQLEQQRQEAEQQRKDAEQQRKDAEQQRKDAEQQRREMKEREILLQTQLEQQRKDADRQRSEADERQSDLMKELKRQGDQISRQSEQISRLLGKSND